MLPMATLVAFHAHPDDECLLQSGSLAKAVHDGHRVVVLYATRGEVGEAPDDLLEPGETLIERRMAEAMRSAEALGVHRVAWLGYRDSGMMGTADNDDPSCFWRADVEEAAARVAAILREEMADVLTVYDENGNYGHPDHIQVHRVGIRAADLAGTPHVLEATISREHVKTLIARAAAAGQSVDDGDHHRRRRRRLPGPQTGGYRGPRQPGAGHRLVPGHAARNLSCRHGHRVLHPAGCPRGPPRPRRVQRRGGRGAPLMPGGVLHATADRTP
jgi:LmbE family N-acetylglucosaminyl deacetylase